MLKKLINYSSIITCILCACFIITAGVYAAIQQSFVCNTTVQYDPSISAKIEVFFDNDADGVCDSGETKTTIFDKSAENTTSTVSGTTYFKFTTDTTNNDTRTATNLQTSQYLCFIVTNNSPAYDISATFTLGSGTSGDVSIIQITTSGGTQTEATVNSLSTGTIAKKTSTANPCYTPTFRFSSMFQGSVFYLDVTLAVVTE